jgi:ABC-2 type transport system permease protein
MFTALQVCLGTLKAGIEMETLRKQGTPKNCLHNMNRLKQPHKKKHNRALTTYFLWPGVLAAVLQQVLLLG